MNTYTLHQSEMSNRWLVLRNGSFIVSSEPTYQRAKELCALILQCAHLRNKEAQ